MSCTNKLDGRYDTKDVRKRRNLHSEQAAMSGILSTDSTQIK